jgi:AcrR family transcriptional regulator
MADNKAAKSRKSAKSGRPISERVAEAALAIASEKGWRAVSPQTIANKISEPLGTILQAYPNQGRIAAAIFKQVDAHILAQVKSVDADESPRDRLFEVMMMRFDALQANRSGYDAILRSYRRDPLSAVCRVPGLLRSMMLMLGAAGIASDGPLGVARAHALAAAYVAVLRTWMKDNSADMAPTMSALDKALSRLESLQSAVDARYRRRRQRKGDQAAPKT